MKVSRVSRRLGWNRCDDCDKMMERCREVREDVYVCRRCWKSLDYDAFMYEHRTEVRGFQS